MDDDELAAGSIETAGLEKKSDLDRISPGLATSVSTKWARLTVCVVVCGASSLCCDILSNSASRTPLGEPSTSVSCGRSLAGDPSAVSRLVAPASQCPIDRF